MASVTQLLDTFTGIIAQLVQLDAGKRNNVVIGGSCALSLMGVKMGREPEDLDVIVYEPSAEQLKFIEIFDLVYQRRHEKIDVGSMVVIADVLAVGAKDRVGRCGVVEAFSPFVEGEVLVRWGRQETATISITALSIATKTDYMYHVTYFDNYKLDCDDVYFDGDSSETDTAAIWQYKRVNGNKINFIIKSSACPVILTKVWLQHNAHACVVPVQSFNTIFEAKLEYGRDKDASDIVAVIKLNLTRNA